ncbi:MAG: hypothetical protein NZ937_07725, partial [Armatimonadetes bacterium]|nr:hypothetical protein [Armatimonadota bacterium]
MVRRFDYYKDGTLASDFDEIALANDGTLWVEWPFCYPPQDPLVSHIPCVRRYDVSGRLLLQIGSLEEPQYGPPEWREKYAKAFRQARAVLSKHPNYLWGEEYRFIDRIHGLWVDRKGRVYVLSALPSLHIFDSHGSPLAVFDIHTDDTVTFQGDLGNLEGGTPSFVDWKGRIYTVRTKVEMLRSMIGKIFYFMRHWVKGWEWEKEVTRHWVEVWEWEKEVKKVFSIEVPEVGCV